MKPAKSFTKSETRWNFTQKKWNSRQKCQKGDSRRRNVYTEDDLDAIKPNFFDHFHFLKIWNASPMLYWQHRNCSFIKMKPIICYFARHQNHGRTSQLPNCIWEFQTHGRASHFSIFLWNIVKKIMKLWKKSEKFHFLH